MTPKLKSFLRSEQTFYAVLICVIGIIAFILGRYSVLAPSLVTESVENTAAITLTEPLPSTVEESAVVVVASSGGTKYHLLSCSGASSIKEENKIYFDSIEQAKAAGYTPAANCKGLQ